MRPSVYAEAIDLMNSGLAFFIDVIEPLKPSRCAGLVPALGLTDV
tara:strand:+ start:243 stop:377 length:135 start_codon:yes stop_codon:yes gene_type:complete